MNIYEVYLLRNMLISYSRNSCQTIWHEVVYSELTEKQNKTALNYTVRADDAAHIYKFSRTHVVRCFHCLWKSPC